MRSESRSQASECCRGRPRRLVRAVRGRRRLASYDETLQDRPSKDGIWGMSVKDSTSLSSTRATGQTGSFRDWTPPVESSEGAEDTRQSAISNERLDRA